MRQRPVRQRQQRGRSLVGERYEVDVGPVAHGGHFVSRHEGRVLFVRHALPGERVVVEVTEGTDRDRYLRADAVQVLTASPQRGDPPCQYAGPGLCGGCDFQHVTIEAQRELKAAVVREQLARLAKLDVPVVVEPVAGDMDGLRWRTRIRWARTPEGSPGLRKHRSHDVVLVEDCLIARPDARHGRGLVTERVRGHGFEVEADGFWQVHPGAPEVLVDAVLGALTPRAGERALDLYAGVGLFSVFLAEAVGVTGHVLAVEGDARAAEHAAANLDAYPWVTVRPGPVEELIAGVPYADVVVLDPPREGAKLRVVAGVASLGARAVAYVACDPAALARDTAIFAEHGYRLTGLRAFDLFPMTHHVECVAVLERAQISRYHVS